MSRTRDVVAAAVARGRSTALPIVQAALAAGLAWLIAAHVVNHRVPFFAPIAAIVCLGISLGQRLRRGLELVAGVALGIGIGDLLTAQTGTGTWQIVVLVALTMSAATLLGAGPVLTVQSAISGVLVATLFLPGQSSGASRIVDAMIGGAAGVVVAALLAANPITLAHRHAGGLLGDLAETLHGVARALRHDDAKQVTAWLDRVRETPDPASDLRTALQAAEEITLIAPMHWRQRRRLAPYLALPTPLDLAMRNTGVLVRRVAFALHEGDALPPTLSEALDRLGDAAELLLVELAAGRDPVATRERLQRVAASTDRDLSGAEGFSAVDVLAQLRAIVVDLLQATGMLADQAYAALPDHR